VSILGRPEPRRAAHLRTVAAPLVSERHRPRERQELPYTTACVGTWPVERLSGGQPHCRHFESGSDGADHGLAARPLWECTATGNRLRPGPHRSACRRLRTYRADSVEAPAGARDSRARVRLTALCSAAQPKPMSLNLGCHRPGRVVRHHTGSESTVDDETANRSEHAARPA
jgi:hypothetical protein